MAAKLASDVAANTNSNPFYVSRAAVTRVDHVHDRAVVDANLLQTKAPYGGIGASAATAANGNVASHRKVGSVQYGMARMY